MYKAKPEEYINYIQHIEKTSCGAVYPYSTAELFQSGDIFSNSRCYLYWHYSGFAFLYGEYDEDSLKFVHKLILNSETVNSRRFVLFVSDKAVERFFRNAENVIVEQRFFFEYKNDPPSTVPDLPDGFKLCEINNELLNKLNGNITPYFSWDSADSFLKKGRGYCIVDGNRAAAWAFTAAVSSKEIDIGIETSSEYRCLGLAEITAKKMIQYCFEQRKRPVWACHYKNIASQKLAEKLGFLRTSECFTVKKLNLS